MRRLSLLAAIAAALALTPAILGPAPAPAATRTAAAARTAPRRAAQPAATAAKRREARARRRRAHAHPPLWRPLPVPLRHKPSSSSPPRPPSASSGSPGPAVAPKPAAGGAAATTRAVGAAALSDQQAAALVRAAPELRPENARANATVPTPAELDYFHAHSDMPYAGRVDGQYTGTTDQIIQWAAYKQGVDADLMRAVAFVESTWRMSTLGDNGDSMGLFQIRRPYHCCDFLSPNDTAFNAEYYAGIIRAYYDGRQGWLNTVSGNGATYAAGDLWGSVGAWASGRWHDAQAESYIVRVQQALAAKPWVSPGF